MTFPVRSIALQNQSITLAGRRSFSAGGLALGGLFRSSGDSVAIGLSRVTATATEPASLHVRAHLIQWGRADSLTAIAVQDSELVFGDPGDSAQIRASVHATGGRARAVALQRSNLVLRGGDDTVEIRADITGCAGPGSEAVAVEDSWIGLNDGVDRITITATGPNALWGRRAAVRGWDGDDLMVFNGASEDPLINAFGGDDRVIINGAVRSTGRTFIASDGTMQSYGRIGGGPGDDVLTLGHLTGAQFTALMRPDAGPERGFCLGSDTSRYLQFEQVVCGDGTRFDLVGMGVA